MNSTQTETFRKARADAINAVENEHGPIVASMVNSIVEALITSSLVLDLIENPLFRIMAIDLMARLAGNVVTLNVKAFGVPRETGTLALESAKRIHSEVLTPLLKEFSSQRVQQDEEIGSPLGTALFDLMETLSAAARAPKKPANNPIDELLKSLKK